MNPINLQNYTIDITQYEIIEPIKQTFFSTVYLVKNKTTGEKFVAKTLIKQKDEQKFKKMVNREIIIMISFVNNPTIVKIKGYSMKDFYDKDNITIIMKYYKNGSLADFLEKARKGVSEILYDNTAKQKLLIGIIRSLIHIHNFKLIHRDLKPENILLDDDFNPILTDFGLSAFIEYNFSSTQSMQCGTLIYNAPEVLVTSKNGQNNNLIKSKRDIYAFGIMMYEIITGKKPYPEMEKNKIDHYQFIKKVVEENYRPKIMEPINENLKKLMEQCWANNPTDRPDSKTIYQKLAFGIENNIVFSYNIFNDSNEIVKNKYFLGDVDDEEIKSFIEKIDVDYRNDRILEEKIELMNINKNLKQELEKKNDLEEENTKLKQKLKQKIDLEEEITLLTQELEQKKDLEEENKNLKQKLKQKNDLEEKIAKLTHELEKKNDLEEENKNLIQKLKQKNDLEEENSKLKQKLKQKNDLEEEINKLTQELEKKNDLEEENKNLIQKLKRKLEKKNCIDEENINLKQELKQKNCIEEENINLKQELKQKNDLEEENIYLKQELKQMLDKNKKLEKKLKQIEEENQSYEQIINQLKMTSNIPNQNKNSKITTRRSQSVSRATNNINIQRQQSKSTKYDYFNSKQTINIVDDIPDIYLSPFLQNIKNMNSFLSSQNDGDYNEPYLSIVSKEDEYKNLTENTEYPIIFNYYTIEMMFKSSELTKFAKLLSTFNRIVIEINYESKHYESVMEFTSNLRESIKNNIKIALNISGKDKIDTKLQNNKSINFISLDSSVNEIKGNKNGGSFLNCTNLEEVSISSSLQIICSSAFKNCTSLRKILFDENSILNRIGSSSFNNCSSLTHITIPSSVTEIPKKCFYNCSSLTNIDIPDSVIKIDSFAFCNCSKLKIINITKSIKIIGDNSFKDCSSLKKLLIPSSVDFLGIGSFMNCKSLINVEIEDKSNLKSFEDNIFSGCESLETISIPSSLIKIGNKCFYECVKLKETLLGSQINKIGESSFDKCRSLENISFKDPTSVEFIGQSAFANCKSLKQFSIPPKIKTVEMKTFQNCAALKKIEIPTSVTIICENSFDGCSSLDDIKFQHTLKQIKKYAFTGCTSLKHITLPRSVKFTPGCTFSSETKITNI